MSDSEVIRSAFSEDADLCDRVLTAAQQNHTQIQLFVDIARYITHRTASSTGLDHANGGASKKRKLEDSVPKSSNGSRIKNETGDTTGRLYMRADEVSFSVPARKKLSFQLNDDLFRAWAPGNTEMIYDLLPTNIDQVFCLPVPEKAQRQQNFIIFPSQGTEAEQYVWTVPETEPKSMTFGQSLEVQEGDTGVTATIRCFDAMLATHGKRVIRPDANEFASAIPEPHRKGEKAYHVKAHVGSKDGFLFFLCCGIVWGFKKPLAFYPFEAIEAVSYTSVLQRTFNLVITTMSSSSSSSQQQDKKEVEFSMIDQADFAGIDSYIKTHGLNDASMAAERQAKKLNINGGRRGAGGAAAETNGRQAGNGVGQGEEEESELQKAEQQIQDEEDEEEEDYDPGSEGESEGSGSGSESGDDGAGGDADGVEDEEEYGEDEEE